MASAESTNPKKQRCKVNRSKTHLDFKGAIQILGQRDIQKNFRSISKETGHSEVSIGNWQKEAPEVVTMLYHFLKDNKLKFEDLVKIAPTK